MLGSQTLSHLIIREIPLIAFYSQLQLELRCKFSWIRSQGKLTFQESVSGESLLELIFCLAGSEATGSELRKPCLFWNQLYLSSEGYPG